MKKEFRIKFEGSWNGEIPVDYLIKAAEGVKGAFERAFSIVSSEEQRKAIEEPIMVFSGIKKGSTELSFKIEATPNLFEPQLVEKVYTKFKNSCLAFPKISDETDEETKTICEPLLKLGKILDAKTGIARIGIAFDGSQATYRKEHFERAKKVLREKKFATKRMRISGVLREVDTTVSKEKCKIESPILGEIKCTYPPELEEVVCELLKPSKRDVVAEGVMEYEPKTGEYKIFRIESIKSASEYYKEKEKHVKPTNWEKYIGCMKDVFPNKTADEVTEWMIETIWGE